MRRNGPYPTIATYLPPAATEASGDDHACRNTSPWFRDNWAVADRAAVKEANTILVNERFVAAAGELFGSPT